MIAIGLQTDSCSKGSYHMFCVPADGATKASVSNANSTKSVDER